MYTDSNGAQQNERRRVDLGPRDAANNPITERRTARIVQPYAYRDDPRYQKASDPRNPDPRDVQPGAGVDSRDPNRDLREPYQREAGAGQYDGPRGDVHPVLRLVLVNGGDGLAEIVAKVNHNTRALGALIGEGDHVDVNYHSGVVDELHQREAASIAQAAAQAELRKDPGAVARRKAELLAEVARLDASGV